MKRWLIPVIIVVAALAAALSAVALLGGLEDTPPAVAATSSAPTRDSVAIDVCAAMRTTEKSTANMTALGDQAARSQVAAIRTAGEKLREQAVTAAQRGGADVTRMEALAADLIAECRNAGYA